MNLGMTAVFPRADHLTLWSLWRLLPGYLLLVLLPAVTLLFPKLRAPAMPNTPFRPHWDKKHCDQVQAFVPKSTCRVTYIVRKDPLKALNSGPCFHQSRFKPFKITQLHHQPVSEAAAVSCGPTAFRPLFFQTASWLHSPLCSWTYYLMWPKRTWYWTLRRGAASTGKHLSSYTWPISSQGTCLHQSQSYSLRCRPANPYSGRRLRGHRQGWWTQGIGVRNDHQVA